MVYFARSTKDGQIFQGKTAVGYSSIGGLNGAISRYYKYIPEKAVGWILYKVDENHNITEVGRR